jgi:hypothetical protein
LVDDSVIYLPILLTIHCLDNSGFIVNFEVELTLFSHFDFVLFQSCLGFLTFYVTLDYKIYEDKQDKL